MTQIKRTPLYPEYEKHGAKTIDFGGWDMPVQFSGIKNEHFATRSAAGLFDVSHMGEIIVEGPDSEAFLQQMLTNDLSKLNENQAQYTIMCYEDGGTVDDLIVYKLEQEKFLLVVNASNTEKDFQWLLDHKTDGVSIHDFSEDYVQLAIQGPKAEMILQQLTEENLETIKFFYFIENVRFEDVTDTALVSRTGYTGEDGFEIYINARSGRDLWNKIIEVGESHGLAVIGLGARDTLRFEATLPLYGQELSKTITPLEAGLGFAVKTDKEVDFIGKAVLKEQKMAGTKRKLVGIEMIDKGIPRTGYKVLNDNNEEIGEVTTGTQSPTLNKNIGLALVHAEFSNLDTECYVQVRKRNLKAKVVSKPFYKRS
ncbi:glycine cleavage system aminomethyltransferase GcvT [Aquibacillus kalidii]|uniref:glycine cleavage system aminomethyltransferase GcvT n=1 Tax=Aquibacillus kalidii TaxID=2762597 RepID=UPI0016457C4D|nr:glycine cleavage system aminomethyltransferase GcvT [Aquibacillus kalidii]